MEWALTRRVVGLYCVAAILLVIFANTPWFYSLSKGTPARAVDAVFRLNAALKSSLYYWQGALMMPVVPAATSSGDNSYPGGMLVTKVADGSPTARAGLRPGDVILTLGGLPVYTARELVIAVADHPGPSIKLQVWHRQNRRSPDFTIENLRVNPT